jgi:hypothetical protein
MHRLVLPGSAALTAPAVGPCEANAAQAVRGSDARGRAPGVLGTAAARIVSGSRLERALGTGRTLTTVRTREAGVAFAELCRRIHCGVEVTESSTNKQHTLSLGPARLLYVQQVWEALLTAFPLHNLMQTVLLAREIGQLMAWDGDSKNAVNNHFGKVGNIRRAFEYMGALTID